MEREHVQEHAHKGRRKRKTPDLEDFWNVVEETRHVCLSTNRLLVVILLSILLVSVIVMFSPRSACHYTPKA